MKKKTQKKTRKKPTIYIIPQEDRGATFVPDGTHSAPSSSERKTKNCNTPSNTISSLQRLTGSTPRYMKSSREDVWRRTTNSEVIHRQDLVGKVEPLEAKKGKGLVSWLREILEANRGLC